MEESGFFFLAVAIGVIIVLIIWYVSVEQARRRTEQFRVHAGRLGMKFSAEADPGLLARAGSLALLGQGHGRKARNVGRRSVGDVDLALFDYQYTTGAGKSQTTWHQTVLLIECRRLRLTDFTLRPKSFWDGVAAALGRQYIEFDACPSFADAYRLEAPAEEQARALFEPVTAFFVENTGWWIEGHAGQLVLFRRGRRVELEERCLADFVLQGLTVASLWLDKQDAVDPVDLLSLELEFGSPDSAEGDVLSETKSPAPRI